MTLTKQQYGFVATAVGLVITGTLWFSRTEPIKPLAVDSYTLRQAYVERCLATQYDLKDPPAIETNWWDYIDAGSETISYFPPSTNPALIPGKFYMKVGARAICDPTGTVAECVIDPPELYGSYRNNNYSNKFILGVYSNLTVAGFVSPYEHFNGVYTYSRQLEDPVYDFWTRRSYTYTNTDLNGVYLSYGYDSTTFFDLWSTADDLEKRLVPWCDGVPFRKGLIDGNSFWGYDWWTEPDIDGVTITKAGLDVRRLQDAPMYEETVYRGWPMKYGWDAWSNELGRIDSGLLPWAVSPSASACDAGGSLVRPFLHYTTTATNFGTGADAPMIFYIDKTQWNCSSYGNPLSLLIDFDDYAAAIGGVALSPEESDFVRFYRFSDNVTITNGVYRYYNGRRVYNLQTNMLTERYYALKELTTTLHFQNLNLYFGRGGPVRWGDGTCGNGTAFGTNIYYFYTNADTWAECVAAAETTALTNGIITTYSHEAPLGYVAGRRNASDSFDIHVVRRYGKLGLSRKSVNSGGGNPGYTNETAMCSNIQSKVSYYAKAIAVTNAPVALPGAFQALTGAVEFVAFADIDAAGLVLSNYAKIDSDSTFTFRSNAWSSVWLGMANPAQADFMPPEPSENGRVTIKGFQISDQNIMVNWDFQF